MPTYTPERLFNIAAESEAKYKELIVMYPPGTYNKERNDAHELMEMALSCAEYMEKNKIEEAIGIGPFCDISFKKGEKVRIKKGAIIHTTAPCILGNGPKIQLENKRNYVCTVFDFNKGWAGCHYKSQEFEVRSPQIHWVGSSGYWKWTDISGVEKVVDKEAQL